MEPGEIKKLPDMEGSSDDEQQPSNWKKFKLNIRLILEAMKKQEIYNALLFFVITGLIVPSYEDITYYFLIDVCHITQDEYDILNMCQSFGIILGIVIFYSFLKNVETWKIILAYLIL